MTKPDEETAQRERIAEALDAYLQAWEAGENPTHAEFLRRYPDLSDQLQECLQSVDFMHAASTDFSAILPSSNSEARQLGDFRLLRELGRGGMGVVYEAVQISLDRSVALKVLPFASLLDRRQLERFKNEARAAAMLKHPNIVSVHSVGSDRSVQYYVMELIRGQSLADVIATMRDEPPLPDDALADTTPAASLSTHRSQDREAYYRCVAELGVQAAEALEFAHQRGVIHRDVKPSNLLLDEEGQLHVTDFGLARIQASETLTMSADILGTLRYMSPEQAEGKYLDHRTDVYSLGTTLFELLTLTPVLRGKDRQQLLRQLADPQPLPPRRTDPSIPRDLESIVLKAMAASPEHRYGSAQELSADLRRFLSAKPVLAQRPGRLVHAARWMQRNRLASLLVAIVFLLTTSASIVSPIALSSYMKIARENQMGWELAEARRRENQRLLTENAMNWIMDLEDVPHTDGILQKMVHEVTRQFDELMEEEGISPTDQIALCAAYWKLGYVVEFRLDPKVAVSMHAKALSRLKQAVAKTPEDKAGQLALAKAYCLSGLWNLDIDRIRQGVAVAEQIDLVVDTRDPDHYIAHSGRSFVAIALSILGDVDGAERILVEEAEIWKRLHQVDPDNWIARAGVHTSLASLGGVYRRTGRLMEAEQAYRKSVAVPVDAEEGNARFRVSEAAVLADLGDVLLRLRRPDEADRCLMESHRRLQQLSSSYPGSRWTRSVLSSAKTHLAYALMERGASTRALHMLNDAAPKRRALYLQGLIHAQAGEIDGAKDHFESAITNATKGITKGWANSVNDRYALAYMLSTCPVKSLRDSTQTLSMVTTVEDTALRNWRLLGIALYRSGDWRGAIDALEKAKGQLNGGDAVDDFFLAMAYHHIAEADAASKHYHRAIERVDRPLVGRFLRTGFEVARLQAEAETVLEAAP